MMREKAHNGDMGVSAEGIGMGNDEHSPSSSPDAGQEGAEVVPSGQSTGAASPDDEEYDGVIAGDALGLAGGLVGD
jgi:hypothetical protein